MFLWQMKKQGPERPTDWPEVTQQKATELKSPAWVHSLDSLELAATLLPVFGDLAIPPHPKPLGKTGEGFSTAFASGV